MGQTALTAAQRRALKLIERHDMHYNPKTGGAVSMNDPSLRIDRRTMVVLFDRGLVGHDPLYRGRYVLTKAN